MPAGRRHRADRPVRLRQVDVPADAQPDARARPGRRSSAGRSRSTATTSTAREHARRPTRAGGSAWSSRSRTRSRRCRIADNVLAGLKLAGDQGRTERATTLVEEPAPAPGSGTRCKDRLDSPGGALSGGQQQRLCIARSLAVQPAGPADGRAVLGPRPDLDAADRGDDRARSPTT